MALDVEGDPLAHAEGLFCQGDARAAELKNRARRYLAAGVINAVNFYGPALIVAGGELTAAWAYLTEELLTRVRGRSFGFASVTGAAGLVMRHVCPYPVGDSSGPGRSPPPYAHQALVMRAGTRISHGTLSPANRVSASATAPHRGASSPSAAGTRVSRAWDRTASRHTSRNLCQ